MSAYRAAGGLVTTTRDGDRERILGLLRAIGAGGEAIVLTIDGEPVPKPRARHGNGRTFATRRQRDAEGKLAHALRTAFPRPLDGNVALAAIFFRSSRRVVDRDNLDKLLCDASNTIVVHDDSQVTAGAQARTSPPGQNPIDMPHGRCAARCRSSRVRQRERGEGAVMLRAGDVRPHLEEATRTSRPGAQNGSPATPTHHPEDRHG